MATDHLIKVCPELARRTKEGELGNEGRDGAVSKSSGGRRKQATTARGNESPSQCNQGSSGQVESPSKAKTKQKDTNVQNKEEQGQDTTEPGIIKETQMHGPDKGRAPSEASSEGLKWTGNGKSEPLSREPPEFKWNGWEKVFRGSKSQHHKFRQGQQSNRGRTVPIVQNQGRQGGSADLASGPCTSTSQPLSLGKGHN